MTDGEVQDDWVKWKILPSTVTEERVAELERLIEHKLPPLCRFAHVVSRFHLFSELGTEEYGAMDDYASFGLWARERQIQGSKADG
jgi:hypothetical protein